MKSEALDQKLYESYAQILTVIRTCNIIALMEVCKMMVVSGIRK